jgi:CBS domain-containing protein
MVTAPATHDLATTVARLRAFFRDDHVHMALLVHGEKLVGTVERADLEPPLRGDMPACTVATLAGRTVGAGARLTDASAAMKRDGRRRLAVIDDDRTLVGLLCLKASGAGFCSDADVRQRRA